MPTIQLGDRYIYFAARGSHGAPLVFIHGAGDNHLLWNGQLAAFASTARPLALDLPGHGRSRGEGRLCGAARVTISDFALAVRDLLDALALKRAILVGISMGGAIAQTLALEFPERASGLVLVGTGAKLRVAPAILQGIQDDFDNFAPLLAQNLYASNAPAKLIDASAATLLATGAQTTYDDFTACDSFDVRDRLAEIRVPALIVCGSQDRMTPPKYSEYLSQNIAGAELRIIENAGHMAMLEQAAEFNRIVAQWLARAQSDGLLQFDDRGIDSQLV